MLRFVGKMVFKYGSLNQAIGENDLIRDEEIELIDPNTLLQQQRNNQQSEQNDQSSQSSGSATNQQIKNVSNLDLNQAQTLLALINNQIAMFRMRLQENDLKDRNKSNWYLIAVALDRFCLICYAFIMILGLFIVLI